jgi:hypothetical protein
MKEDAAREDRKKTEEEENRKRLKSQQNHGLDRVNKVNRKLDWALHCSQAQGPIPIAIHTMKAQIQLLWTPIKGQAQIEAQLLKPNPNWAPDNPKPN